MVTITKQAINRLKAAPIEVRLWNGCFNKAKVITNYSNNKSYELTVEVTHPLLEWQCGVHNEVVLTLWKGCTGHRCEIPEELNSLIEEMKSCATMQDDEALAISARNEQGFMVSMKELGVI